MPRRLRASSVDIASPAASSAWPSETPPAGCQNRLCGFAPHLTNYERLVSSHVPDRSSNPFEKPIRLLQIHQYVYAVHDAGENGTLEFGNHKFQARLDARYGAVEGLSVSYHRTSKSCNLSNKLGSEAGRAECVNNARPLTKKVVTLTQKPSLGTLIRPFRREKAATQTGAILDIH